MIQEVIPDLVVVSALAPKISPFNYNIKDSIVQIIRFLLRTISNHPDSFATLEQEIWFLLCNIKNRRYYYAKLEINLEESQSLLAAALDQYPGTRFIVADQVTM